MKRFINKILNLNVAIIFLFTLMVPFNWHDSSNSLPGRITFVINLIGEIGLLFWMYAICYMSVKILNGKNIQIYAMKLYIYNAIGLLFIFLLFYIFDSIDLSKYATQNEIEKGELFTYKRILVVLLIAILFLIVSMYRNTIKLLTSAEYNEEQSFGDYYPTFLILLFLPWIAVWIIHSKVSRLKLQLT